MGVTLQVHRQRIGMFQPTVVKQNTDNLSSPCPSSLSRAGIFTMLLIFSTTIPTAHYNTIQSSQICLGPSLSASTNSRAGNDRGFFSSIKLQKETPWLSSKDINFYARMTNGNRAQRGHGITILHWNKGPSFLHNKHNYIETIIGGHKPHILGLSEAKRS